MASFESDQQAYYTSEINRALPTKSTLSNDALRLALGDIDPIMPGENRRQQEASSFLSKFETTNNLALRDSQCRTYAFPNQAMRDPQARTGCGWWYTTDSNRPSVAAYGSRNGPMNSMMDVQYGNGEWIWNIGDAQQKESQRATAKVKVCKDLDYFKQQTPNIGWCATMNSAIMTDGNGNPAYPNSPGGYCPPGEKIAMTSADCPVPQPQSSSAQNNPFGSPAPAPVSISSLCAPSETGALTPGCLKKLTLTQCSPSGSLAAAYANGYPNTSQDFMDINAYLTERGFTLNSGILNDGRVSENAALQDIMALRRQAGSGEKDNSTAAAMNMCYGSPFNPCNIPASKSPPHDIKCIKKTALEMGYSPNGRLLQTTSNDWSSFPTWGDVLAKLKWWKDVADKGPAFFGGPSDQKTAIENVYSVEVYFPTSPNCSPAIIRGLTMWYDAADRATLTLNGNTVVKWGDKSGKGNHLFPYKTDVAPLYNNGFNNSYPAIMFNGPIMVTSPISPSSILSTNGTDSTVFVVFNRSPESAINNVLYGLESEYNTFVLRDPWAGMGTILDIGNETKSRISITNYKSGPTIYSITRQGANASMNMNGSLLGQNTNSSGSIGNRTQRFCIGGGLADGAPFNSYIAELIIFNTALSIQQIQQTEGYLAWKWGLNNQLQSSHPFSKIAP